MSVIITDSPRVSCLTCNSKVELRSTKNIYRTKFTQSGESLAPFVSSTLLLPTTKFRSPYLCPRCLNLFGKLEEASRKVKNIKNEIHKAFQDSYHAQKNIPVTIQKVEKDSPTKSNIAQVSPVKPKVIITRCTPRKSTNTLVQRQTITNNLGLSVNPENKKISIVQLKNNRPGAAWINLKTYQDCLKTTDSHAEAVAHALAKNKETPREIITLDNDDVDLASSLQDHQYSQLPITEKKVSISKSKETLASSKVLTIVQQKVSPKKKILEPKKEELTIPESYTCSNCGIEKETLRDLKLHCKTHPELYPYMCEKCGKVYKNKKSLRIHMRTHDRTRLVHRCTVCNKTFSQKGALKRHLPIHTGEKPYECQICWKKFVHHTSYSMHILVHTKEKKHKCETCSLAFMSSSHLKRHMKTHTGEKRHSCNICGKSFYERYNVVAHMKIHDSQHERMKAALKQKRPIQRRCERCKIDFNSAGEYNVHIRKHTPENMPSKENEYLDGIELFDPLIESTSTS